MLTRKLTAFEIEKMIHEEIGQILEERDQNIPAISPQDKLNDVLGISSLDLAQLVSVLEIRMVADPFAELVPITSVSTVGELCQAYQIFFEKEEPSQMSEELRESQRRAQSRRNRRGDG